MYIIAAAVRQVGLWHVLKHNGSEEDACDTLVYRNMWGNLYIDATPVEKL